MSDQSFAERFKRLEPIDLLGIINNPNDYQPAALDAARAEFASRRLTEEQLREVETLYQSRIDEAKAKENKRNEVKAKVSAIAAELSPAQFGAQPQDKYIRSITIFAVIYFLFMLYQRFWFFRLYFEYSDTRIDWSIVDWVLPLLWLPIGGILFGLRRTPGWLLMTAYFWKVAIGTLAFFIFYGDFSAVQAPRLVITLIFGVAFYAITKKEVREVFKANTATLIYAIVIGTFFALVPMLAMFVN